MPVLVPFLVAGILAASSLVAATTTVSSWSDPTPADQCFKYVNTPIDTIEVLLRRVR